MAFAPNTKIWLYEGVELDSDYHNTVYFDPSRLVEQRANQLNFFGIVGAGGRYNPLQLVESPAGGSVKTVMTYQREDLGYVEVEARCEDIDTCNYMIFTNNIQTPNPRYFFAFIQRVEYIAEYTSRIYYKIDVLQTYIFDYDLPVCYVERQHSETDGLYENYVDDVVFNGTDVCRSFKAIPLGTYDNGSIIGKPNTESYTTDFPFSIYVNLSENPARVVGLADYAHSFVTSYNTYYEGYCIMIPFAQPQNNIGDLPMFVSWTGAVQSADRGSLLGVVADFFDNNSTIIQSAYIAPTCDIGLTRVGIGENILDAGVLAYLCNTSCYERRVDTLDIFSRECKNKKMLCYPYTKLQVSTPEDSKTFMPQFIDDPVFSYIYKTIQIYPHYSGLITPFSGLFAGADSDDITGYMNTPARLMSNSLRFTPNNRVYITADSYLAWEQENGRAHETKIIGQALNTAFKTAGKMVGAGGDGAKLGGSVLSAAGDYANLIAQDVSTKQSAEDAGDKIIGNVSGGIENILSEYAYVQTNTIDDETWQRTDDYFTMFGYAQKKLMQPNRRARPYWTYLKTNTTRLKYTNGSIPKEHADEIIRACNRGITWWNGYNPEMWSSLFDYTQDNSPTEIININEEAINET